MEEKMQQKNEVKVSFAKGIVGELGAGNIGRTPGVLSWETQNGITSVKLTTEEGETVFSTTADKITHFFVEFNMIRLRFDKQGFELYSRGANDNATYAAGVLAGVGGSASIAKGTSELANSAIGQLKNIVAASGGKVNTRNPIVFGLKLLGIGFAVLVTLFFGLLILAQLLK